MDLDQAKLNLEYLRSRNTFGLTAGERAELSQEYDQAIQDYWNALASARVNMINTQQPPTQNALLLASRLNKPHQ